MGRGRSLSRAALQAVLFDFDGTLVDTESTGLASWQHLYDHAGHPLDVDAWLAGVGSEADDRYAALAALVGPEFDREAAHALRHERELALVADLPLREGLAEVLDRATAHGLVLAVVSSSPRWWVQGHLERLGLLERFAFVVAREDAQRAKPHPDLYLLALARLGLPADAVLVVEDSVNGVLAARAAGLPAVALPNPVTARQAHVVEVLEPVALWDRITSAL